MGPRGRGFESCHPDQKFDFFAKFVYNIYRKRHNTAISYNASVLGTDKLHKCLEYIAVVEQ